MDVNTSMEAYYMFETKNLKNLTWSEERLLLSHLIQKYSLPQIVKVEEGQYGVVDSDIFHAGQELKIHKVVTEKRVSCYDQKGTEVYLPLNTTEEIILRPKNYASVYQCVSDVAKAEPIPTFVGITCGYCVDATHNDSGEAIFLEHGEILEVVHDRVTEVDRYKYLTFRTADRSNITLPYHYKIGLKPLVHRRKKLLSELISPSASTNTSYNFHFEFVSDAKEHEDLGVLQCNSVHNEDFVIVSCQHKLGHILYIIPENLDLTLRVAKGTIQNDPEYGKVCLNFHNFQDLEANVCKSRNNQIFHALSEISSYKYMHPPEINKMVQYESSDSVFKQLKTYAIPDTYDVPPRPVPKQKCGLLKQTRVENDYVCRQYLEKQRVRDCQGRPWVSANKDLQSRPMINKDEPEQITGSNHEDAVEEPLYDSVLSTPWESCNVSTLQNLASSVANLPGNKDIHSSTLISKDEPEEIEGSGHEDVMEEPLCYSIPLTLQKSDIASPNISIQQESTSCVAIMSVKELCENLQVLNLGKYTKAFEDKQVDGKLFCQLNEEEIMELGLCKFEAKKLLLFKDGWTPKMD